MAVYDSQDFNPHSRKGSDRRELESWDAGSISIHTPARGVTFTNLYIRCVKWDFNPHSRKGSDWYPINNNSGIQYFNPHSRKGSDVERHFDLVFRNNFNPHSRKGSDVERHFDLVFRNNFNPHSRKGSDVMSAMYSGDTIDISIHTPARGVTIFYSNNGWG